MILYQGNITQLIKYLKQLPIADKNVSGDKLRYLFAPLVFLLLNGWNSSNKINDGPSVSLVFSPSYF